MGRTKWTKKQTTTKNSEQMQLNQKQLFILKSLLVSSKNQKQKQKQNQSIQLIESRKTISMS